MATRPVLALAVLLAAGGGPALADEPAGGGIDFSGAWRAASPRSTILADDSAIPFTALGRRKFQENRQARARRALDFDLMSSRCSTPGMPRMMLTAQRFRIFQDAQVMTIGFEWNRVRRVIGMPALPPQISLFNAAEEALVVGTKTGTSRAHWEGDTLVVVTTHIAENTLLDDLVPHDFDLRLSERLRLTGPGTLEDRITIEDPAYFTRPWEVALTYRRQPDAIFPEDVCLDRRVGRPPLPGR